MTLSRHSLALACTLAVPLWLAGAGVAWAHAVDAECKLRDGKLEVEAYFDDDTPARGARVSLEETQESGSRVIAEGVTDKAGRWSYPAPAAGSYWLVVDAGSGHRVRRRIAVPEGRDSVASLAVDNGGRENAIPSSDVISEGRSRHEFTRIPWGRVFLGLGILAAAAGVLWLWLSWRRNSHAEPVRQPPID